MPLDLQKIYCKWAEQTYGLTNVEKVEFDDLTPVQGCETCGYGGNDGGVEVTVWSDRGVSYHEERYSADLINDLMQFVAND